MTAACRPPGRSPMRSWSPVTARPSSCSRCAAATATTRPSRPHSTAYPFPPVPGRARRSPRRARALKASGPASLLACRSASTSSAGSPRGRTPWDAFPNTDAGKFDAETGPLAEALRIANVRLVTGAMVERLIAAPDGRRIAAVDYERAGETRTLARRSWSCSPPARSIRRSCCCASADERIRRPRQPLRPGRPQFHEPQQLGDARHRSAAHQ